MTQLIKKNFLALWLYRPSRGCASVGVRRCVLVLTGLLLHTLAFAAVDIVINLDDSPDPAPTSSVITYTINVANNGPDDATGVAITYPLPNGTTLQSVTTTQGSCTGTTTIICNIGNLDNNLAATVVVKVLAPTGAANLSSTVTSTRNEVDTTPGNDTDTEATTVTSSSDLRMTKTDSKDPVSQGEAYTYSLSVQNLGPQAHPSNNVVTITDVIPDGMRLRSIPTSTTGWSCTSSAGTTFPQNGPVTVTCTRTSAIDNGLAINGTYPPITVPVTAVSFGNLINSGSVSSTWPDRNTTNNTSLQQTTINQAADLTVAPLVSPTTSRGVSR